MGASGSGKSVCLKMLIGLLKADSGSIRFDGEDITTMNEDQLHMLRRRIAYLFQGAALFDSLTVGENVAYGLREQFWNTMSDEEIRARASHSLELVGLPGSRRCARPTSPAACASASVWPARSPSSPRSSSTTSRRPASTRSTRGASITSSWASKRRSGSRASSSRTTWGPRSRSPTGSWMIRAGRVLMVGTKEEWKSTTNGYVKDFIEGRAPENEDVSALLLG